MTRSVSKESMNITKEKVAQLKKLFPEVISEGKIDVEKLRRTLGENIGEGDEKYGFTWAGRRDTFKNIQTSAKGTLIPNKQESANWDKTDNLFIEGDNLEVLKLLQKSYFGKIKMIYIDPPYNRGKGYDLIYNDNYSETINAYLIQTGQISKDGFKTTTDLENGGRYHSNWISMMYPRLFMARHLLKEDGVIFISINDREFYNLRNVMNEIFGEENFVGTFIWKNKAGGGGKQSGNKPGSNIKKKEAFVSDHEYIVVYSKDIEEILRFNEKLSESDLKGYSNPDNDPRGPYVLGNLEMMMPAPISTMYYEMKDPDGITVRPRGGRHQWRFCKKRTLECLKDGSVIWEKVKCKQEVDKRGYRYVLKSKQYLYNNGEERTKIARSILYNIALNADGTREIMELFDQDKTEVPIFSNPKPTKLLKHLIKVVGTENEIILDFFAGSGSTAHAVLELNKDDMGSRNFICVQIPEKTTEKSEAFKSGYKTIADISKERIRRAIKKIGVKEGFRVFKLKQSNYKIWENYDGSDKKALNKQMQLFKNPLISGYNDEDVIYECIIKEGYSLNSKIEKLPVKTNIIHKVTDGSMFFYICLDQDIKAKSIDELKLKKDTLFICLDESLNDSKKTNLAIQCNLKTI